MHSEMEAGVVTMGAHGSSSTLVTAVSRCTRTAKATASLNCAEHNWFLICASTLMH
jgi:hypothetical protein